MSTTEIKYDEIKEFIKCPLKFKFMRNDDIESENNVDNDILNEALKETFIEFYRQIDENEKKLNFEDLKKKFGEVYYQTDRVEDIVKEVKKMPQKKKNKKNKYLKVGRDSIKNFADRYYDEPGVPIAYDWDFTLKFSDLKVTGSIPVIRQRNERIEIFTPHYSKTRINNDLKDNYPHLPLLYVAYKEIADDIGSTDHKPELLIYKTNEDKERISDINERKIESSLYQMSNIRHIINNDLYYKSVGRTCKQCGYMKYCQGWTPEIPYLN